MRRLLLAALLTVLALALAAPAALADPPPPPTPTIIQPPLDAGAPIVTAAASPTVVRLGATFTVFVTIAFDPGVEVNLREPVELGPAFEVRRRDSADRAGGNGKKIREYQLEVIAWDVGDLQLPPIAVTFTLAGHAGQVATNPVPLRVDSMLGAVTDDPKPRGDEPPAELTARDWLWIYISAAAGGVLVATIATLVWRRRRRGATTLTGGGRVSGRKLDTPGGRALARLLEIERSGALERDSTRKSGYAAMAIAIRDYLGARYRVATRDLTTSELMRALARETVAAPLTERMQIQAWLERCDVVKYGGLRAAATEAREVLAEARALVVATSEAPARVAA